MAEYTVYTKIHKKKCFMALNQSNSVKTFGSFFCVFYYSVEIFIYVWYLEKQ